MTNETQFVDPDEHEPDVQSGAEYSKPKNLAVASDDHPLVQQTGTTETLEWNVPPTVLKHVSDGLYVSEEATFREFLANSETACLRTDSGEGVAPDDYQPIIEVTYNRANNEVVFQDNGVGMTSRVVVDVLRNIGVTTIRDSGNYSGQFGMGLASFLKLIGSDNSMIMKTHSRITDENYAAYVNLGGFDPVEGGLPDDIYGTRFEMIHKPDVDPSEVRDYVEKYAEHLRVPVHYEEYDTDGKQVFDEDWGGSVFEDEYDDDKMVIAVEEEGLFRAVCSPDSAGQTLLVSMPIDRGVDDEGSGKFDAPYQFDLRILDESGAIVKCEHGGEHEGLSPVPDSEYRAMEPDRQERYIPESQVPKEDITLPTPTTSRDQLQENVEFFEWLGARIRDKFYSDCEETFQRFDSLDDILNSQGRALSLALTGIDEISYGDTMTLQQAVEEEFNASLTGDVCEALEALNADVERVEPKTAPSMVDNREEVRAYEAMQEAHPDGDVYMGVQLLGTKARLAWGLHDDNVVVQVSSTDEYERFTALGWKKLTDLKFEDISKESLSREVRENIPDVRFESGSDEASSSGGHTNEFFARYDSGGKNGEWLTADSVRDVFEQEDGLKIDDVVIDKLVLFPSDSERNVSDFYDVLGRTLEYKNLPYIGAASCSVKEYQTLRDVNGVTHCDDFVSDARAARVETSEGTAEFGNIDTPYIHLVPEETASLFKSVADNMHGAVQEMYEFRNQHRRHWGFPDWYDDFMDNGTYVPVGPELYDALSPAICEDNIVVLYGDEDEPEVGDTREVLNDFVFCAGARLHRWQDSKLLQEIYKNAAKSLFGRKRPGIDDSWRVIEAMTDRHDAGKPAP